MKKLIAILLLILLPFAIWAGTIKVATFNMLRLGDSPKKDFAMLAKVVSQFDVIGCIEVIKPIGVEKLVSALGKNWSYFVSESKVGSAGYKEYFAFVWNSDKVQMVRPLGFFQNDKNQFIRPPYAAIFKSENLDFTLVVDHIVFGTSSKARVAEVSFLSDVYDYFFTLMQGDKDIIIAGDFNDPNPKDFSKLLSIDNSRDALGFGGKTTIGFTGLASDYDHMFINKYIAESFVSADDFDYVKAFLDGNYVKAKADVSDHLPVYIELDTSIDTDKYIAPDAK